MPRSPVSRVVSPPSPSPVAVAAPSASEHHHYSLRSSPPSPTKTTEPRKTSRKIKVATDKSLASSRSFLGTSFHALLDVLAVSPLVSPGDGNKTAKASRLQTDPWRVVGIAVTFVFACILGMSLWTDHGLLRHRPERAPFSHLGAHTRGHRGGNGVTYEELNEILAHLGPRHHCAEEHGNNKAALDLHYRAAKKMDELLENKGMGMQGGGPAFLAEEGVHVLDRGYELFRQRMSGSYLTDEL